MARPLKPLEILKTFERWGVPHDQVPGWKTRSNTNGWSPTGVSGCMHHHTGDDGPDGADRAVLVKGRPGLRGPLANFGVTDRGRVEIISAGAANHAGMGDPRVLKAVRHESYDKFPPARLTCTRAAPAPSAATASSTAGRPTTVRATTRPSTRCSTGRSSSPPQPSSAPSTRSTGLPSGGPDGRASATRSGPTTSIDPRKIDMSVDRADIPGASTTGPPRPGTGTRPASARPPPSRCTRDPPRPARIADRPAARPPATSPGGRAVGIRDCRRLDPRGCRLLPGDQGPPHDDVVRA